ncbi:MAG TPA: hypothetical protein VGA56_04115 [Opitutaceae bacterium]
MHKTHIWGFVMCAMTLALPAQAQEGEDGNIAKIIFFRAKPGMEQQLEEGLKKHSAWHKEQGGTWAWYGWTTETGDFTGGYAGGTFDHSWSDFDKPDIAWETDMANVRETILPFVAEGSRWQYYASLPKVSKPLDKPAMLSEIIVFRLHYGKDGDFMHLIGRFHEAIAKTAWPVNYQWFRLLSGGDNPTYVLVLPRQNYASMKGPEKDFRQMLTEAVGQQEAEMLFENLAKVVKSESSQLERNRPDLSYIPMGK